ncbi:hypothetical protein HGRIS_010470 [Hohenbuehelia grisea]|uniref:Uncharacterized protein n=1 Tax=Hohenbuehelia grisea TaxID=104357 RepID=A0ABR3IZ66_9AGAR
MWNRAKELHEFREYRRALESLEGLVVARLFELSKMNMANTGYKLRKHISKALQTRSKAIRTALDKFNKAAAQLKPPRPALKWEEVVEYAFLSEFNLLRDPHPCLTSLHGHGLPLLVDSY